MRKAMAFPVRFVAEGQSVQTTSRDLDEESVFVRCVEPPEPGERVVLRLYLPGQPASAQLEAEVTEATREGFRARFVHPDEETRRNLATALGAREAAAAPARLESARRGMDKRTVPRFLNHFRVTLSSGQHRRERSAHNLSASGLFIAAEVPPALDEIVHIILELPDGQPPLQAQALVVRRVKPGEGEVPGAGVQFIGADDGFRARLDAYLRELSATASPGQPSN